MTMKPVHGSCPFCAPHDRHVDPVICARHDAILEFRRAWLVFGAAVADSLRRVFGGHVR